MKYASCLAGAALAASLLTLPPQGVVTLDTYVANVLQSSAVVVKPGIILTAKHVVDGKAGAVFHPTLDIAVVPATTTGKRPVIVATRKPVFGDVLHVVGWQLDKSLLQTTGHEGETKRKGLHVASANVTLGSSGSGVFNRAGQLVGIATQIGVGPNPDLFGREFVSHHCYYIPVSDFSDWLKEVLR